MDHFSVARSWPSHADCGILATPLEICVRNIPRARSFVDMLSVPDLQFLVRVSVALPTACFLLAGCSRVGGDATQVAARVNDVEISLAQLQHVIQRQPAVPPDRADGMARKVLDGVIDQELAAQAARSKGLDKDPRVIQSIEAAKREVLAKAYQDSVAEKATQPSTDEIDRYFDSQPALFAQRRFYVLQEVTVQAAPDSLAPLQRQIQAAADPSGVTEVLKDAHLRFNVRQLTVSPEDMPMALLARLSELQKGQSLMLAQLDGGRVLTLLSSEAAPIARDLARPAIQSYLLNDRKRHLIQEAMKTTREAAHIEYKGKFVQAASPAASAPASGAPAPTDR